eukprot:gene15727-18650_t
MSAGTVDKLGMSVFLMISTSAQPILAMLSKEDNEYKYNFATVPLIAEFLKLLTSTMMLLWKVVEFKDFRKTNRPKLRWERVNITTNMSAVVCFIMPSILYVFINNIAFLALTQMSPSTFQILNNIKILTAGLAFRIFLKRPLNELQWIALLFLVAGCTVSQIKTDGVSGIFATPVLGYMYILTSAALSAVAGVYTEFILKKNNDCLDWQQMQLYGFGVFFNIVTLTIADLRAGFNKGAWAIVLLDGYNWATYMCVVNLSFAGMLTSWVLKFADTVTKVIATSMAMLLSSAISIIYFKEQPSLQLFLGIGISTLA